MLLNKFNPVPTESFANQDQRFARAFGILEEGIANRAFPGASVAITYRGDLIAHKALGRFTYGKDSSKVTTETIYDLASVTKVVATTAAAMLLHEQGSLDLESRVVSYFPNFGGDDQRRQEINIRMLLAHSSGLPAYVKLFEKAKSRDELVELALTTPLAADPMSRAEYSDIGFIILGEILSRTAQESLDSFCANEIFDPLRMAHTGFCPVDSLHSKIPPTLNNNDFRKKVIQGEVQDENAWVMEGVSGHAGVFATAYDVALFALCMLRLGSPVFHPPTVAKFTQREPAPEGNSRALGFDTPSAPSQSGQYFSSRSFGHLGYTGTSLWCDPVRQLSVTLLTNRVWPDNSSQAIKEIRPRFHDAVIEAIEGPVT